MLKIRFPGTMRMKYKRRRTQEAENKINTENCSIGMKRESSSFYSSDKKEPRAQWTLAIIETDQNEKYKT